MYGERKYWPMTSRFYDTFKISPRHFERFQSAIYQTYGGGVLQVGILKMNLIVGLEACIREVLGSYLRLDTGYSY
jgi:hypothetical protein